MLLISIFIFLSTYSVASKSLLRNKLKSSKRLFASEIPQVVANFPHQFDTRQKINHRVQTQNQDLLYKGESTVTLFDKPIEVGVGQYRKEANPSNINSLQASIDSKNLDLLYKNK
jgi:hypothetical protein